MAGPFAITLQQNEQTGASVTNQWTITFSRFFTNPLIKSTCHHLKLLKSVKGTWISSASPTVSLQISHCPSDAILTVCFEGKIFEEHYVSRLQYTWPQLRCDADCPVRGSRIVFVSFTDSDNKIQKFALRFSNVTETREFIKAVEDIIKYRNENEPLNSDFRSEFSCQSVYMPSSTAPSRNEIEPLDNDFRSEVSSQSVYIPSRNETDPLNFQSEVSCQSVYMPISSSCVGEASDVTPIQPYSPELPLSLQYEVEKESLNEASKKTCEVVSPVWPPSFTSLLNVCYSQSKQGEAEPNLSQESYLKSQIAKYMEDPSFQEMLLKVEKVIDDIGLNLM